MNKMFIIFCFFYSSITFSQSIRPLNGNLKDIIEFDKHFVAYGSDGSYLTSKDKGITWDEKLFTNKYQSNSTILKLFERNHILFGFNNENRLIQNISQNGEINFEETKLNLPSSFIDLYLDSLYLYVLCQNHIIILNIKNEIINKIDIPDSVKLENNLTINNRIYVLNNTICFSANKNQIFKIENNLINKIYDFSVIDQCKTCQINNILLRNGIFYLIVDGNLYISKDCCKSFLNKFKHIGSFSQIYKNNIYFLETGYNAIKNISIYNIDLDSITYSKNDSTKYLSELSILSNFCILNEETIIGVGLNKLITKTTDKGENWEIISMFSNIEYLSTLFWLNDSIGICALKPQSIQITQNAGKTWSPTKYTDEMFKNNCSNIRAISFYPNGKGLFLINNGGYYNNPNFGISSDFGKSVKIFNNDSFLPTGDISKPEFSENQNYIIDSYGDFPPTSCSLIISDTNYNLKSKIMFRNSNIEKLKIYSDNHYQALVLSYKNKLDTTSIDSIEYYYLETFNSGKSWDTIFKFNPITIPGYYNRIYSIYQETNTTGMFCINERINSLEGIAKIYRYSNDSLKLIYSDSSSFYVRMFKQKNNLYCISYTKNKPGSRILKFDNNIWINEYVDTVYKFTEIYQTKNKLYLKGVSNSNFYNIFEYKFAEKTSIDCQTEEQTYFYSYPPYPIPARNELKSLIYWDMNYNIDDSDIGVYDIYGIKVADREKISINKLNSYSGYLTWDCSGASTGVYMIQIKHGTNTHNIRAMVVR